jgi:hypothetical protein
MGYRSVIYTNRIASMRGCFGTLLVFAGKGFKLIGNSSIGHFWQRGATSALPLMFRASL